MENRPGGKPYGLRAVKRQPIQYSAFGRRVNATEKGGGHLRIVTKESTGTLVDIDEKTIEGKASIPRHFPVARSRKTGYT